jgi:uncharacterized protein DUF6152
MYSKITLAAVAASIIAVVLLVSGPVFAHHGTGISYDLTKLVTVKGTITNFAFHNPHSQLYWDTKDENGNIVHWSAEMNAPSVLERAGYTRKQLFELLKPGTEVTVTGFRSKSGAPVVVFSKAVTPTGELKSLNGPGRLD